MDKDKINSKIEDLEAELQKLKQLANEPKQRTPEAGDVWADNEGFVHFISASGKGVDLISGHISFEKYSQYPTNSSDTYLGKHKDVYVKISDVRDAVVSYSYQGSTVMSTEALCDLNIITY